MTQKNILPEVPSDKSKPSKAIIARSILAGIPYIGSPISVYVESVLNDIRQEQIDVFIAELSRRVTQLEIDGSTINDKDISQSLFYSASSFENWKPVLFARVITSDDTSSNSVHICILNDIIKSLTDLELSIFLSHSPGTSFSLNIDTAFSQREHVSLAHNDGQMPFLRQISIDRLVRFGLLASEKKDDFYITPLGDLLIGIIAE